MELFLFLRSEVLFGFCRFWFQWYFIFLAYILINIIYFTILMLTILYIQLVFIYLFFLKIILINIRKGKVSRNYRSFELLKFRWVYLKWKSSALIFQKLYCLYFFFFWPFWISWKLTFIFKFFFSNIFYLL